MHRRVDPGSACRSRGTPRRANPVQRSRSLGGGELLPIAVWCDLDAYGIRIVHGLSERLGRNLIPVGMSVELYTNGIKYRPDDPKESQRVARKMHEEGPEALRTLAHAIAESGGLGCEQETLYDDVLGALSGHLREMERAPIAYDSGCLPIGGEASTGLARA